MKATKVQTQIIKKTKYKKGNLRHIV